jgi:very-short-patch-repair endonuclease
VRGPCDKLVWMPSSRVARARDLRKAQTDAEKLLWRALRRRELDLKFRRQHPVGRFILDFYCEEARLAVELDGGGHAAARVADYDSRRTAALERFGVTLLRFWNSDVFANLEGVVTTIVANARRRG